MVVVRIKHDANNIISSKINNDSIKIISDLKLCKMINDTNDSKYEKKIEFITHKDKIDSTDISNNIFNTIDGTILPKFNGKQYKSKYFISSHGCKYDNQQHDFRRRNKFTRSSYESFGTDEKRCESCNEREEDDGTRLSNGFFNRNE